MLGETDFILNFFAHIQTEFGKMDSLVRYVAVALAPRVSP